MIDPLPPVFPGTVPRPAGPATAEHPMRAVTRDIAFGADGWHPTRRDRVRDLFDELAPTWPVADEIAVAGPLVDALERGVAAAPTAERGLAVDLGGGNGRASGLIAARFARTVLVDLSHEMLERAPADVVRRVQADAAQLPLGDGSVDVLVCTNMFLFPTETGRVLAPDGVLVWVNSWGAATPIHLDAAEVDAALPGSWAGVGSAAGEGTWSVHWRADRGGAPSTRSVE